MQCAHGEFVSGQQSALRRRGARGVPQPRGEIRDEHGGHSGDMPRERPRSDRRGVGRALAAAAEAGGGGEGSGEGQAEHEHGIGPVQQREPGQDEGAAEHQRGHVRAAAAAPDAGGRAARHERLLQDEHHRRRRVRDGVQGAPARRPRRGGEEAGPRAVAGQPRVSGRDGDAGQGEAPPPRAAAGLLLLRRGEAARVRLHGQRQPRPVAAQPRRRAGGPRLAQALPHRTRLRARALLPPPRLHPAHHSPRHQSLQHPPGCRLRAPRRGLRPGAPHQRIRLAREHRHRRHVRLHPARIRPELALHHARRRLQLRRDPAGAAHGQGAHARRLQGRGRRQPRGVGAAAHQEGRRAGRAGPRGLQRPLEAHDAQGAAHRQPVHRRGPHPPPHHAPSCQIPQRHRRPQLCLKKIYVSSRIQFGCSSIIQTDVAANILLHR